MACSGPRLAPPLMPSVRFHELLRRDIWRNRALPLRIIDADQSGPDSYHHTLRHYLALSTACSHNGAMERGLRHV
jgi:hypothetical protein